MGRGKPTKTLESSDRGLFSFWVSGVLNGARYFPPSGLGSLSICVMYIINIS